MDVSLYFRQSGEVPFILFGEEGRWGGPVGGMYLTGFLQAVESTHLAADPTGFFLFFFL